VALESSTHSVYEVIEDSALALRLTDDAMRWAKPESVERPD